MSVRQGIIHGAGSAFLGAPAERIGEPYIFWTRTLLGEFFDASEKKTENVPTDRQRGRIDTVRWILRALKIWPLRNRRSARKAPFDLYRNVTHGFQFPDVTPGVCARLRPFL